MHRLRRLLYEIVSIALACAGVIALVGCASPVGIAASTHPIPADKTVTRLGPVSGSSYSGAILFLIPFGSSTPVKAARDDALAEFNADAPIGVTVEYQTWFLLLMTLNRTAVSGEAIKLTD